MKRSWLTWLGLGAACAVCCAPLLAPFFVGAGAAGLGAAGGSWFGLGASEVICLGVIAAIVVGGAAFVFLRARAARRAAECACASATEGAQCDVTGACAPQRDARA